MKALILATFFIIMQACVPVPRQEPQKTNAQVKEHKATPASNQKPSVPSPGVNPANPIVAKEPINSGTYISEQGKLPVRITRVEGKVDVRKDWLDYIYIGATLIVAVTSLFLALAAKSQAKAAQLSAQSVMNSERPWLLVEKTATRDRIQDPDLLRVQQVAIEKRLPNCVFYLRNYGKTVAKMTFWEYSLQIGDIPTVPPDKSIYDFRTNQTFIPDVVPQGRPVGQYATFKTIPPDSEFDAVDAGTKFLWLCGVIRYFSASGTEYRTKFCYLWERRMTTPKPFWRVAGPKEYTEAT